MNSSSRRRDRVRRPFLSLASDCTQTDTLIPLQSMPRSSRCSATAASKPCALTARSDSATSAERCAKRRVFRGRYGRCDCGSLTPGEPSQVWINQGDIVLLSLRDFQDGKADVIQKYSSDEARKLKQYGELPETAKINETDVYGGEDGDDMVDFGEVSGEDEGPLNGAVPESDSDESIGGGKDDFDIVRQLCRRVFFLSSLVFAWRWTRPGRSRFRPFGPLFAFD